MLAADARKIFLADAAACELLRDIPWLCESRYLCSPDYNRRMHEVVVYSRNGCHLCDIVKETLRQFEGAADFQMLEVDIDDDPQLQQKYNEEVPVVFIDGRKVFKYHMDGQRFLRALAGRP